jgi:hypothetical protein
MREFLSMGFQRMLTNSLQAYISANRNQLVARNLAFDGFAHLSTSRHLAWLLLIKSMIDVVNR